MDLGRCDGMSVLNLWSLSHLLIWFTAGRWTHLRWPLFVFLSLAWECFEWAIDGQKWASFAVEPLENKISDVAVNIIGFWLGSRLRIDPRDSVTLGSSLKN